MESNKHYLAIVSSLFLLLCTVSCDSNGSREIIRPGEQVEAEIQDALNHADAGETIEFDNGTFSLTRTLTMDGKTGVTLKGQGRNKTIFSFSNQVAGGDGLLITNSDNVVVQGITIRDTAGDGLKFKDSDGIVIDDVGAEWSGEPKSDNGGYGIYPVNSSNILIENSYAYGASDAGIYVGQSDKAIVRNSVAQGNVAGIEIENTSNADVHGNVVSDNAAGILVFDLPGLLQYGYHTRVFENTISQNNRGNFALEGSIVAEVPAGTGILVLSTSQVEIFDNSIEENNVMGTAIASYASLVALGLRSPIQDQDYNPFPREIYLHNNNYSRSNTYPEAGDQSDFGNMLVDSFAGNPIPDVILDGVFAPGSEESGLICIEDNGDHGFVNLNLANSFPNNLEFDASVHDCSMNPLAPVEISIPDF